MASLVRYAESSQAVTCVKKSFEDHPKKTILQCLLIIGALGSLYFTRRFPWPARIGVAAGTMFLAIAMEALKRPSQKVQQDSWNDIFGFSVSSNVLQALSTVLNPSNGLSSYDVPLYDTASVPSHEWLRFNDQGWLNAMINHFKTPVVIGRNIGFQDALATSHPMVMIFVESVPNDHNEQSTLSVIVFGEDPIHPKTWKDFSSTVNPLDHLIPTFSTLPQLIIEDNRVNQQHSQYLKDLEKLVRGETVTDTTGNTWRLTGMKGVN